LFLAVTDLLQRLAPFLDVDHRPDIAEKFAGAVEPGGGGIDAPAIVAVRTSKAEVRLVANPIVVGAKECPLSSRPILFVDRLQPA
jgi:hypothetical protein